MEQEKLQNEMKANQSEENRTKDEFSDNWDDDGGDWFSSIPLNKITSTVRGMLFLS